jgi:hypothetical protein
VLDGQADGGRPAEAERPGPVARHAQPRRRRQATQIQQPERHDEGVPGDEADQRAAIDRGRDQPQRADTQQPEGARADAGADAMGTSADPAHRRRREALHYVGTSTAATMSATT